MLYTLICAMLWGVFAHGMAMFNKFSYHDDVPWFNGVGETYGLGRWFLGLSGNLTEKIFLSRNYSTPVFNGILTLIALALICHIIFKRLRIQNRLLVAAVTGVMVCFPAITNIFGYVFTAPYYYIGALAGVYGAYLFYEKKTALRFFLCTFLMSLSVGLYQSNIAINLIVLLLFMIDEIYTAKDTAWKDFFTLGALNAVVAACFMAQYFLYNFIALKVTGLAMYDYKGVSSFGRTDISGYIYRIYTAYKRFLKPADFINYNGVSANMYPWMTKYLHIALIVLTALMLALMLLRMKENAAKITQLLLLLAASPLFAYFLYVMVEEKDAHGGMGYAEAFMVFITAYAIERLNVTEAGNGSGTEPGTETETDTNTGTATKIALPQILTKAAVALIIAMGIMFARYANVCYLKADLMQAEAINYYNRLIERIRTTEGYTPEVPVAYINDRSKNDDDFSGNKLFDPIYLPPYQGNSIINDFSWEKTMNMWCAFSRVEPGEEELQAISGQIGQMPVYPSEGSVQMLDGIIVVKFAQ